MSFMENQVLGYESPLYGRRTAQFKLLAFDYLTSAEMLYGFSNEDKLVLYSITGGIPEYLSRIDNTISVYDNVRDLLFDPSGRLFEEPSNLLKQELKIPHTYNAIITAIADGKNKCNEIATRVGIETSQCSNMLNTLIGLGLIKKEVPVTEKIDSKKTIYLLDDQMFIFWYRFVLPEISRITSGLGDVVCNEVFDEQLSSHVGYAFEKCAVQYMWWKLKEKALPVSFKKIGRWWGNNPKERCEEEIDFIAYSNKAAIFGECKWRNRPFGEDVLDDLIRKSELFTTFSDKYYFLFSKSGFTDTLKKRAKQQGNITLVTAEDMFTP
jgi:AAA+ ATPase superfamily predicted ATPase